MLTEQQRNALKNILKEGISTTELQALLIEATIEQCKGNKSQASKVLGLSLRAVRYKVNGCKPQPKERSRGKKKET